MRCCRSCARHSSSLGCAQPSRPSRKYKTSACIVITTGEDSGGEDTSLEIECDLSINDTISFEHGFEDKYKYSIILNDVTGIYINGKLCKCSVGSEGGNKDTFLIIK